MKDWPISNYPFFSALVLLAATAITLAAGDEPHAEELAIYAYYFLVIGVVIRFFELTLPENTLRKPAVLSIPGKVKAAVVHLDWKKIFILIAQTSVNVTFFIINAIRVLVRSVIEAGVTQKIADILRALYFGIVFSGYVRTGTVEHISTISRNVAISLFIFFLISMIYGSVLNWSAVKGYLSSLLLIIIYFLAIHLFTKFVSSRYKRSPQDHKKSRK